MLVLITTALAAQQECQDRLRAEIQDAVAKNPDLSPQVIEGMPYLNNFVREVFRLYSPSQLSNQASLTRY